MVFVYLKDGNIIRKALERRQKYESESDTCLETTFPINANLIMEDGFVKEYEHSKQYKIDRKEVGLKEENIKLKKVIVIEKKRNQQLMNDFMRINTENALLRTQHKT